MEMTAKLFSGEIHCKYCEGTGNGEITIGTLWCSECRGTGKFDWIEMITGKREETEEDFLLDIQLRLKNETKKKETFRRRKSIL